MATDMTSLDTLALWFSNYSSLASKAHRPKLAAGFGNVAQGLESRAKKQRPTTQAIADSAQRLPFPRHLPGLRPDSRQAAPDR